MYLEGQGPLQPPTLSEDYMVTEGGWWMEEVSRQKCGLQEGDTEPTQCKAAAAVAAEWLKPRRKLQVLGKPQEAHK